MKRLFSKDMIFILLPLITAILAGVSLHNDKLDWALTFSLITLWLSRFSEWAAVDVFEAPQEMPMQGQQMGASRHRTFIPYSR